MPPGRRACALRAARGRPWSSIPCCARQPGRLLLPSSPPRQGGVSLCLGELRVGGSGVVLQRGQEQRLVNPTLEDRHAHLHALGDHFPPVHTCFSRQFGGGQMDRHSQSSLRSLAAIGTFYRTEWTVPTFFSTFAAFRSER